MKLRRILMYRFKTKIKALLNNKWWPRQPSQGEILMGWVLIICPNSAFVRRLGREFLKGCRMEIQEVIRIYLNRTVLQKRRRKLHHIRFPGHWEIRFWSQIKELHPDTIKQNQMTLRAIIISKAYRAHWQKKLLSIFIKLTRASLRIISRYLVILNGRKVRI